jgi:uncharacterized membrane protein
MTLHDISPIGWLHSVACIVAMISGSLQLFRKKGTPTHARSGNVYFVSMVILNVTALFIYRIDVVFRGKGPELGPVFGVFHWLAVVTLAILLVARFAASHQGRAFFAYLHPICMILTYWFLMGGAINQAFERVEWVKQAALAMSPQARSAAEYKLLFLAQFGLDLLIFAALAIAVVQVRRRRRRSAVPPTHNAPHGPAVNPME